MFEHLTLAVAQIANAPGAPAANLAVHLARIEAAAGAGVDLLLFPELSLTGYVPAPDCAAWALRRASVGAAALFTDLARAAGRMAVSVGFIEQGDDGRYYNAQALLVPGDAAIVHRKLNLPGYGNLLENRVYTPGDAVAVARLDTHWRLATLICADHWNPALPWLAALAGANLVLAPAASARSAVDGFDNPRGWAVNLAHTALTYGVPVAFANYGSGDFWGGSRILDANGDERVRAGAQPELITAEISATHGQIARQRLPTARDADPARVLRLLVQQCR